MKVSVLIPVLDEAAHLPEVVARMRAQTYSGELEFLFIDGGSTDGSVEYLTGVAAHDPRIRLLHNPAKRTPQALNIGLREATGDVICRMDAHTHYPETYVETGLARLLRGDAVSVSGPAIAVGHDTWSRRVALALATTFGVGQGRFRLGTDEEIEVDTGFTGLWRRETLEAQGGWDEEMRTDQDYELAVRLTEAGGRHVCLPSMSAEYFPRNSLKKLWRQYFVYGYYKVLSVTKHPQAMRPSHLLPPGLAGTALVAVAGPLRRPARLGLGLYAAALARATFGMRREAPVADVLSLPLVFATMHLAYGLGFLWASVRRGPPLPAVVDVARRLLSR
jgi:glycosyltransferase involved in cell wall biosynthesis